ncbi:MAG: hypothetical protein QM762_08325 [Chryseolinea sp.]
MPFTPNKHAALRVVQGRLAYSDYIGGSQDDEVGAMAVDSSGAVYLLGFTGSPDFPLNNGSIPPIPAGGYPSRYGYLLKINPDGSAPVFATYFGGAYDVNRFNDLKVDSSGNIFIAGACGEGFPTTPGTVGSAYNITDYDSFGLLAKLKPDGTNFLYATYIAGAGQAGQFTDIDKIQIASDGSVYALGDTSSLAFPTTPGVVGRTSVLVNGSGYNSLFLVKINPSATQYVYATYLDNLVPSSAPSMGGYISFNDMAIDAAGNVILAGQATAAGISTTSNAYQAIMKGSTGNGFIYKLSSNASSVLYASYFGGSGTDGINAMVLDADGNIVLAGATSSADFPTTPDGFMASAPNPYHYSTSSTDYTQPQTGFVAKLNPALGNGANQLVYSTYYGGLGGASERSEVDLIKIDSSGNLIFTGSSSASTFPVKNEILPGFFANQKEQPFVASFDKTGHSLLFSMALTAPYSSFDGINALVCDSSGSFYLSGSTLSYGVYGAQLSSLTNELGWNKNQIYLMKFAPGQNSSRSIFVSSLRNPSNAVDAGVYGLELILSLSGGDAAAQGIWSWCDGSVCNDLPIWILLCRIKSRASVAWFM